MCFCASANYVIVALRGFIELSRVISGTVANAAAGDSAHVPTIKR